jgi:hypothetical protein
MERRNFRIFTLLLDIVILTGSFLAVASTKPASLKAYVPSHILFFLSLAIIWLIISLLNGKMHRGKVTNYRTLFFRVLTSNIVSVSITALLMFSFRNYAYSRTVVLGTFILATLVELIVGAIFISYKKAVVQDYEEYERYTKYRKPSEFELVEGINGNGQHEEAVPEVHPGVVEAIVKESGPEMAEAILKMTGRKLNVNSAVLSTTTTFNILSLPENEYSYIINLHKINDIPDLDSFIDSVNRKLEYKGYFFCIVETKDQRKARILKKFPPVIKWFFYSMDFVVKRIFPKLKFTRPLYFFLTRGDNAVISRAEALGRICRGGFKIKMESFIGNRLCIEARKYSDPKQVGENVYGPLIALPRVGRDGKLIKVYKLRTMHPYSEYIQDYVYQLHDLRDGGKFKNDFRITSWGAVCRKIWLDEFPMLINLFKGQMKLVGVRPLSKQYFELYDKEVQDRRIKYKPGLIPPFYADMPTDLESIQASEIKYLNEFDRHPFLTDFRYFWKSGWNILFKEARSN